MSAMWEAWIFPLRKGRRYLKHGFYDVTKAKYGWISYNRVSGKPYVVESGLQFILNGKLTFWQPAIVDKLPTFHLRSAPRTPLSTFLTLKEDFDDFDVSLTAWKVSKYGVFSGPNAGKYGPKKTPYMENFHAASSRNNGTFDSKVKKKLKVCAARFFGKLLHQRTFRYMQAEDTRLKITK